MILLLCLAFPTLVMAQEETRAENFHSRKPGTYLKFGLAHWKGNIFNESSLKPWKIELFGTDYELTSLKLSMETYFSDSMLQLSGLSIGYRKDSLNLAESGHMINVMLFRDFNVKTFTLKVSSGIEWGIPSLNFDKTKTDASQNETLRYRHTHINRNANVPFIETRTDGTVYPFIELSIAQRPWGLLIETGVRLNFISFNLDDYKVNEFDQLTFAFTRKRFLVPYVFADFGYMLF
jgi:hypothetical protein